MIKRLIFACLALSGSGMVHADDASPGYTQCMDSASSTTAMATCIQAETQLQDGRLNRVYKQLLVKLEPAQQTALRDVQRQWIAYRDGNCTFHRSLGEGSLYRLEGAMCVMNMSRERAAELERVLSPGQ